MEPNSGFPHKGDRDRAWEVLPSINEILLTECYLYTQTKKAAPKKTGRRTHPHYFKTG